MNEKVTSLCESFLEERGEKFFWGTNSNCPEGNFYVVKDEYGDWVLYNIFRGQAVRDSVHSSVFEMCLYLIFLACEGNRLKEIRWTSEFAEMVMKELKI